MRWQIVIGHAVKIIADADFQLRETVEHVEFGQRNPVDARHRQRLSHEPFPIRGREQVRDDHLDAVAQLRGQPLQAVGAPRREHHVGTRRVQDPGEAVTEAGGGPGHHCHPVVEAEQPGRVDSRDVAHRRNELT